MVKPGRVRRVG